MQNLSSQNGSRVLKEPDAWLVRRGQKPAQGYTVMTESKTVT